GPFTVETIELGAHIGRRGRGRSVTGVTAREEIRVDLLRRAGPGHIRERTKAQDPLPRGNGPGPSRDRAANGGERQRGMAMLGGAGGAAAVGVLGGGGGLEGKTLWGRGWARGEEGGSKLPPKGGGGKPGLRRFPAILRCRVKPYSAFIRAIIFLFAALSFRLR